MNTYTCMYSCICIYIERETKRERQMSVASVLTVLSLGSMHQEDFFCAFFYLVQKRIKGKLRFYMELEIKCLIYAIEKKLRKSGLFSTNIYGMPAISAFCSAKCFCISFICVNKETEKYT